MADTAGSTLYIRGVDEATSTRFKVLAAHHGMSYPQLLAKLTADAFDQDAGAIFERYEGTK